MSCVFWVMRTHTLSHTASKVLWQVMSKPFDNREQTEPWRDYCESEYRDEHPQGPHRFFCDPDRFPNHPACAGLTILWLQTKGDTHDQGCNTIHTGRTA